MGAVAAAVKTTVEQGEKVVLFCDHHATAQELTAHLASVVPGPTTPPWPECVWKNAWDQVLEPADHALPLGETAPHVHRMALLGPDPCADVELASAIDIGSQAGRRAAKVEGSPPQESGDDRRGGTATVPRLARLQVEPGGLEGGPRIIPNTYRERTAPPAWWASANRAGTRESSPCSSTTGSRTP